MKEMLSKLTWVDCLAVLAVLRGFWVGYRSGFFPELLRIIAYLATVLVTFHYHETLAQFLTLKTFLNYTTAGGLAFLALLVVVFSLTKIVTWFLLRMLKVGEGSLVYRILGMILGAARWVILLSLVFMLVDYSPIGPLKTDIRERSMTGARVARIAPMLFEFLSSLSPQLAVPRKI